MFKSAQINLQNEFSFDHNTSLGCFVEKHRTEFCKFIGKLLSLLSYFLASVKKQEKNNNSAKAV
ncbi:MAG: hypothetical protein OXJ52_03220, partial [Oligoflexia bacterium]|nr:hypothetical protein [Oligoflexia bacterium]